MDLETENRIASILLKEAAELRRQAQQEGALAYLRQPTVRGRPNSRFLTATVRGIQQANRAVEMNEMWRVRQKELELDERCKSGSTHTERYTDREGDGEYSQSRNKKHDLHNGPDASCSSSKQLCNNHHAKDNEGLRDEELEKFLHSRVKRGRGSVGSRMDEAGPYLSASDHFEDDERYYHRARSILGPQKPSSLKPSESSDESSDENEHKRSKVSSEGFKKKKKKKKHSKKHSWKEKSRDKKKKRREKRHED